MPHQVGQGTQNVAPRDRFAKNGTAQDMQERSVVNWFQPPDQECAVRIDAKQIRQHHRQKSGREYDDAPGSVQISPVRLYQRKTKVNGLPVRACADFDGQGVRSHAAPP